MKQGDVVCFPRGNVGGHQIINRTDSPIRVLMLSSMIRGEVIEYLDTGKVLPKASRTKTHVREARTRGRLLGRRGLAPGNAFDDRAQRPRSDERSSECPRVEAFSTRVASTRVSTSARCGTLAGPGAGTPASLLRHRSRAESN